MRERRKRKKNLKTSKLENVKCLFRAVPRGRKTVSRKNFTFFPRAVDMCRRTYKYIYICMAKVANNYFIFNFYEITCAYTYARYPDSRKRRRRRKKNYTDDTYAIVLRLSDDCPRSRGKTDREKYAQNARNEATELPAGRR